MADVEELARRVEHLEWKLAEYNAALESALEHDRAFQLQATWGIVNTGCGIAAFAAVQWLASKLGLDGWLVGVASGVVGLIAWGAAVAWSDKGREGDLRKLARLPRWSGASHDTL